MPSCVIKSCKNSSAVHTKQGVSFHKLPRDPVLKCKWTSVIREDRNDKKWKPSKFTTVCSVHFDEKDLYETENGLQRVVKNAIPKKNLCRKSNSKIQDCLNKECPEESDNSSKSEWTTASKLEPAIQVLIPESSELSDTNDISISKENTKSNESQSGEDTSETSNNEESVSDSDIDSIIEKPHDVRLQKELRKQKKVKLENCRKIKTLNQKVRRLKRQNKSLKSTLKGIKEKYLIDPKIDKAPTLNEVPLEIFRNIFVNRKKKVHYSPAVRKFCLTLNSYSPKAYEYVREILNSSLPHPKTLPKWHDITSDVVATCGKDKSTLPDDFSSEDDYTTEIPEQYLAGHHYPPVQQNPYPAIQHNEYQPQENYPKDNQYNEPQNYMSKPQDDYSSKQYEYPTHLPVP